MTFVSVWMLKLRRKRNNHLAKYFYYFNLGHNESLPACTYDIWLICMSIGHHRFLDFARWVRRCCFLFWPSHLCDIENKNFAWCWHKRDEFMQTHAPENSLITFVNVIHIYVRARREFAIFLLSLHNFCFVFGAKKMGFFECFSSSFVVFYERIFWNKRSKSEIKTIFTISWRNLFAYGWL